MEDEFSGLIEDNSVVERCIKSVIEISNNEVNDYWIFRCAVKLNYSAIRYYQDAYDHLPGFNLRWFQGHYDSNVVLKIFDTTVKCPFDSLQDIEEWENLKRRGVSRLYSKIKFYI